MTLERALVWAVGIAACVVAVLLYFAPPTPSAQLTVAALGVLVVLPLSFVFAKWLLSFRTVQRGWRDGP